MPNHLVVLAFDSMDEAEQVHQALVSAKNQGVLSIEDAAVIVKDPDGKIDVKNQVASGTWVASGVGGALGLLLGSIFFPIGGLVLGLAGGALVGKFMDLGIDGKFVKDVGEQIQPGTSALFILTKNENLAGELAVLRQYHGTVLQTTLDTEAEEAIRKALGDTTHPA